MPKISIPEILIRDYNLYDLPHTYFNRRTEDENTMTYKIANRRGHSNCLVQINPTELIEANT